jgi:hypothetical protein
MRSARGVAAVPGREVGAVSEETSPAERQAAVDEEQPKDGDLSRRHAELNEMILRHLALLEVLRRRSVE